MTRPEGKKLDSGSHLIFPFAIATLGWIVLSILICCRLYQDSQLLSALQWMSVFTLISLMDLVASSRLVTHLLSLASGAANRTFSAIRASYWAAIKIACLLLFGITLLKGHFLPLISLLLGGSTLLVVPLFGGILWYCMGNRSQIVTESYPFRAP